MMSRSRVSATSLLIAACVIAIVCNPGLTFGQWLHYPTGNVPRTADGKPNLTAPAPHLANGKPDFSGIWVSARKLPCTPEVSKFVECGLEIADRRWR